MGKLDSIKVELTPAKTLLEKFPKGLYSVVVEDSEETCPRIHF